VASWAVNHAKRGEHRTEITEVTERAGTVGTYASPYADTPYTDPFLPGGHGGELRVVGRSLVDTGGFPAENQAIWVASHGDRAHAQRWCRLWALSTDSIRSITIVALAWVIHA
jgi:hypothetical protein